MNVGRKFFVLAGSISFLAVQLCLVSVPVKAAEDKPTLAVFLDKSDIRQNDAVRVHFQVSNNSAVSIGAASIAILSPEFEWHCSGCPPDNAPISSVDIGNINPNQSVDKDVWFRTGAKINVGQSNLLFRLETTSDAKPPQKSVSLVEKPVSLKLLGTDTLAGIPLALSGLIVPGLCFWLILSWFGVSWSMGLALGDKIIYSILVSLFLLIVDSLLFSADLFSGLSVHNLVIWGASGAAPGVVVGLAHLACRKIKAEKEQAVAIGLLDDAPTIFRKLLVRCSPEPGSKPLYKVSLKNREVYYGSMAYEDTDRTLLVGWYKISKATLKADPTLQPLATEQNVKKLYAGLLEKRVPLEEGSAVQQLQEKGYGPSDSFLQSWNKTQIRSVEKDVAGWNADPLTMT